MRPGKIVDNFAGGGGASTGIEFATGRIVDIAINHDAAAILMHETNHPHTKHLQASVWDVDPMEVCSGEHVSLAWFSPDCKHFSKASGTAPRDRKIRGLAWIELRWAATVRPDLMITENVEEFLTWGPLNRRHHPIKSKKGQTFQRWRSQLIALGYAMEWRILNAADYGAPTSRKRLVIIARCDGEPIVWPERTHAPRGSEDVRSGKCKPWRSAAEVIDWSRPCPSIFSSKDEIMDRYGLKAQRPLRPNTLRRVIRGVDKYTIRSGAPFLVDCNHSGSGHISDVRDPVGTVTRKYSTGVCDPLFAPITFSNTNGSVGSPADWPVHTITSDGKQVLTSVQLIQYHMEQSEYVRASALTEPLGVVDASNRYGLAAANLVEYYGNGRPLDVEEPMRTATSHDREALTLAHICKFKGKSLGQNPNIPLQTITARANSYAVVRTVAAKYEPNVNLSHWPEIRELLNKYCGYEIADDEVLLLHVGDAWYFIADIGLRMLTPRELFDAMGFPPDYMIECDWLGNVYPKNEQVARCGNAVAPPMAAAVVRANWREAAVWDISTMAELERRMSV